MQSGCYDGCGVVQPILGSTPT